MFLLLGLLTGILLVSFFFSLSISLTLSIYLSVSLSLLSSCSLSLFLIDEVFFSLLDEIDRVNNPGVSSDSSCECCCGLSCLLRSFKPLPSETSNASATCLESSALTSVYFTLLLAIFIAIYGFYISTQKMTDVS